MLSYARPFVTCIAWPIASVIVSGGEILLMLTLTCTKSKFDFPLNALWKKEPFFHKKVPLLANIERCPKLLEYALMIFCTLTSSITSGGHFDLKMSVTEFYSLGWSLMSIAKYFRYKKRFSREGWWCTPSAPFHPSYRRVAECGFKECVAI